MMDNDEKLIAKFFAENKQEFVDNGFSERVMQRLPAQEAVLLNRIWTLLCVAVGVVFIALTGSDHLTQYFGRFHRPICLCRSAQRVAVDSCCVLPHTAFRSRLQCN